MLADDVLAALTGPGSVYVRDAAGTETRGMFDDGAAVARLEDGDSMQLRVRTLEVAAAAVSITAEQTITVGALEDDETTTEYRVLDVTPVDDGLVLRVGLAV